MGTTTGYFVETSVKGNGQNILSIIYALAHHGGEYYNEDYIIDFNLLVNAHNKIADTYKNIMDISGTSSSSFSYKLTGCSFVNINSLTKLDK